MLTKIEKIVALIDLVNNIPNVEFKMRGISKPGMVNVSKAKVIDRFGDKTLNSLLSLPSFTEKRMNNNVSLIHYTVYGKHIFAIKNYRI